MKIAILGSGSWGSALTNILLDNNHNVTMYGRDEEQIKYLQKTNINKNFLNIEFKGNINYTTNLQEAICDVDFIVNTIPTQGIRDAFKNKPIIKKDAIIINASKGIEINTLYTISQIFYEFYPENTYSVLSGPSHAEEVIKRVPTTLVAACKDLLVSEKIQDLFMNEYIRVYANEDVLGVEISGALKNIIAICNGICIGMNFGDNTQAALISRGIIEIKRLGLKMGAKSQTFDGLTGIGDLIVTCMSKHSRNRRFGELLGKGYSPKEAQKEISMVIEGVYTIVAVHELAKKYNVEMPIQNALYDVMYNNLTPKKALTKLMQRTKKHELEII